MKKDLQQKTREAEAQEEAGHTDIRRGAAWAAVILFLLICGSVPLYQIGRDWKEARSRHELFRSPIREWVRQSSEIVDPIRTRGLHVSTLVEVNRLLLQRLNEFEDRLEDESRLGRWIRPILQTQLSGRPGVGNEQAYVGKNGWLFYRPDMEYLTGPGFLDPQRLAHRAATVAEWEKLPLPDPRPAILDFKRQLEQRGILLIVMPTPVKPGIHPEQYTSRLADVSQPLHNRSYQDFLRGLKQEGVWVFDPSDLLVQRKRQLKTPQYLATDTHWRPEAMEAVAQELARRVNDALLSKDHPSPGRQNPISLSVRPLEWSAHGDIALMLDLPKNQTLFPPEAIVLQQIFGSDNQFWRSSETDEVLVLGDSFSNIYSLSAIGWGESAGFVEQFARYLGRPVDRLVRNDDGAFATRDMLRRELARGRDRLAGKRIVIWQFTARELANGDWRVLPLELGTPPVTSFVVPAPNDVRVVTGIVRETSPTPRPGSVPYRDHIVAVHLVDLPENGEAMVYMRSMEENEWTRAARLRNGEEITVRLQRWADVAATYDGINRSELDNLELQLQEPCWGEIIK